MASNVARRARTRSILILIILATLPCYCLGFVVLQLNGQAQRITPQPDITETATLTVSPTTAQVAITPLTFPSQTQTLTPTITWTPSATPTLFNPPTRTPTNTVTASDTPPPTDTPVPPSDTPAPSETPTPTPTEEPSPTPSATVS